MTTKTATSVSKGQVKLYGAAFALAIIIFSFGAYGALQGSPLGWEVNFFQAINGWSEGWYRLFTIVTFFGSTWIALISVVGVFALRMYRLAWRLAITIVGAYGVAFLAKHFIGRDRPLAFLHDLHVRAVETGMGFPSGHATISTVVALTLWPYLPKMLRYIIVPVFIVLVCVSRLYLGVHFPLDVVGGAAIGVGAVSFVRLLPQKWRQALRLS